MYRHPALIAESPRTTQTPTPRPITSVEPTLTVVSEKTFQQALLEQMPLLEALSSSMCKDRELAKDLAQDTFYKAWRARAKFKPGTNMKAWLCTILRNLFYSHHRRAWRSVTLADFDSLDITGPEDTQEWAVVAADTFRALHALPPEQRQAVMLVGLGGLEYGEAAAIVGCPQGTLKSRVSRGRKTARTMLDGGAPLSTPRPAISDGAPALMRELETALHG